MKKLFIDYTTLSDAPLLIQVFAGAVSLIFTLFVVFLISRKEIKPKWIKYSIYASLFLAFGAFCNSWNEKRFFAGCAENFVALLFHYGGMAIGIAGGYFIGTRITEKTSNFYENFYKKRVPDRFYRKPWPPVLLGWVVGIGIAALIFFNNI
jgi:uncharacterized protein YneF (UPF0154 family)